MHNLRSILIELMKIHKINPTQLCNESGVSRTAMQLILSGKTDNPRLKTCLKLAKHFNVSLSSLVGYGFAQDLNNTSNSELVDQRTCGSKKIPVFRWEDALVFLKKNINKIVENEGVLFLGKNLSDRCIALKIQQDDYFVFLKNSFIIVDPEQAIFRNGDFVLMSKDNSDPFLRKVQKEGNLVFLKSHIYGVEPLIPGPKIEILGKVVLSVLDHS